jgi:hypothetical protein
MAGTKGHRWTRAGGSSTLNVSSRHLVGSTSRFDVRL